MKKVNNSQLPFQYSTRQISFKNGEAHTYLKHHAKRSIQHEEFLNMQREISQIPAELFVASVNTFWEMVSSILNQGDSLNCNWLQAKSIIKGSLKDDIEEFDPVNCTEHKIVENLHLPMTVRKKTYPLDLMNFEKVDYNPKMPVITEVSLFHPEIVDEIHLGRTAKIEGANLNYNPEFPESGIRLIDSEGTEHEVENIRSFSKRTLLFNVPESLTPGTYKVHFVSILGKRSHITNYARKVIVK
ncbi:MAG: DNA-binding domain-containing protein [Hyphomicrobiales bacterium]